MYSIQPSVKVKKPLDGEAVWISNMVEVTSKLAKNYAIPAHKRSEAGTIHCSQGLWINLEAPHGPPKQVLGYSCEDENQTLNSK